MYQRNERNKLVFRPEMLKQGGEGLYIVCENDEELKACIENLHKMGIPWKSGSFEGMYGGMITYAKIADKGKNTLFALLTGTSDTKHITIGNYGQNCILPYCFGFYCVSDFKDEDPEYLSVPRILFKNVEWDFSLALTVAESNPRTPSYEVESV